MAHAYAHLAERERILNYIDNRECELKEYIDTLQSNNNLFAMITERYPKYAHHLTPLTDKNNYALSEAHSELAFWGSVRKELNPCQSCNGYGKVRVFDAQDESHMEPCNACNGSGIAP